MIGSGTLGSGGAIGASASAGAIIGSILSGGYSGALAGGLSGAASSALTSSAVSTLLSGPIGMLVLGAEKSVDVDVDVNSHVDVDVDVSSNANVGVTFDCWKPVLHDETTEPSQGRLLKDVAADRRIKDVLVGEDERGGGLPKIVLKNIWNESFRVNYVVLSPEMLAAHAKLIQ